MLHCPLSSGNALHRFHQDKKRLYLQCGSCGVISVPAQYHLSAADEKAQYDQHQNALEDAGYRKFLSRTFEPLAARIHSDSQGLDFGCGPGAVISQMAKERGVMGIHYKFQGNKQFRKQQSRKNA